MASDHSRNGAGGILVTAAAAVLVAYLAVLLLRPGGPTLEPVPTSASQWFGADQLDRMLEFRGPQRLIGLGATAVELLALFAIAWWATPRLRRLRRRPLVAGALVGAGIALALALVTLPLGLVALERSRDAGLATQSAVEWLGDRAKSAAIGAAIAAAGAAVALLLIRRLGGRWWLGGTAVAVAYAALAIWLGPVVIAPLFNRFEPLPPGPARAEVARLADRAGVEVGEVLVVDAGRRSNAVGAYVTGLAGSRRVVVYDNALERLDRPALRSVLAHELAHVRGGDVRRALFFVVLAAPLGMLTVQRGAERLALARGADPASPAAIPAIALSLTLILLVLSIPGSQLSRSVERRADAVALELTGEPGAMIVLQRRLAVANLADPDPPALWQKLFASHPSKVERIGAALAYRRAVQE